MAKPKKGALHQLFVTMVEATDVTSIKSTITESDFNSGVTKKFYGINTGSSAATTSGAISKLASLVRSGVFRLTLKGTENNYDLMQIRVSKTGAAEQIYEWQNVDNDDSDLMSMLTALSGIISDAHSAATQAASRVLVVQSMASDAASAAQQGSSRTLLVLSMTSDLQSKLSDVESNLLSLLGTTGVQLNASVMSDLRSAVTAGPAGAVTASDMSDIASRVDVLLASRLSDILSAAVKGNSMLLIVQSMTSDLASKLSDVESNLLSLLGTTGVQLNTSVMSDLRSAIGAGPAATITASDISDIASAVRAILASDLSDIYSALSNVNSIAASSPTASDIASKVWAEAAGTALSSRMLVVLSMVSDVRSHVSDLQSDFQSRVPKLVATNSQVSDLVSDVKSAVTILQSMASDAHSAAAQGSSRTLVVQSMASDLASKLSDVESNLLSVLGTTGVQLNASVMSDLRSAITAGATGLDASALSDIASAVVAAIGAVGVGLDASTMSDIRSAVLSLSGLLSDAHSAAAQANSRILVAQSLASDAHSAAVQGSSRAAQAASRALLVQSQASDIYSLLRDLHSDVGVLSGVVSDVKSALDAGVGLDGSTMSDLRSAIAATELDGSDLSDIASRLLAAAATTPIPANVRMVNDVSLVGDGSATPWGPA